MEGLHLAELVESDIPSYRIRSWVCCLILAGPAHSYAVPTLNLRTVIIRMVFVSILTNSWPMQFRGPCSNGWYAPLTGCLSCVAGISQRSGMNLSGSGQYRGSRCMVSVFAQTRNPSVGYCRPWSSVTPKPGSPAWGLDTAGINEAFLLIIATVYGRRFSIVGSVLIKEENFFDLRPEDLVMLGPHPSSCCSVIG